MDVIYKPLTLNEPSRKLTFDFPQEITFPQLENMREMIHNVINTYMVYGVRNGKMIINFDGQGIFQEIEISMKAYRRKTLDTKEQGSKIKT